MTWQGVYRGRRAGRHEVDWDGVAGDPLTIVLRVPDAELGARLFRGTAACGDDTVDAVVQMGAVDPDGIRRVEFQFGAFPPGRVAYDLQHSEPGGEDTQTICGGCITAFREVTT